MVTVSLHVMPYDIMFVAEHPTGVVYGNQVGYLDADGSPLNRDVLGSGARPQALDTIVGGAQLALPIYPLSFERESPESLAERLRWFARLSADERAEIGSTLRERVAKSHSVDTWAEGVLANAL